MNMFLRESILLEHKRKAFSTRFTHIGLVPEAFPPDLLSCRPADWALLRLHFNNIPGLQTSYHVSDQREAQLSSR